MPGSFPGIPGLLAFGAVKFGGYCLAGLVLRKAQPAIASGAWKIAGARTGLGILIGPPLTIGLTYGLANLFPQSNSSSAFIGLYAFVFALRILIWALLIYWLTTEIRLAKSKLWSYAALGALWSCILDLPGVWLAFITPGQIPFC